MPTISVIVPVYKVENYIHRCVDSILGQTFANFELILVDDGSPDNCGTICDAYAAKDSRVVVIHQKNGGLSAARNAGIDWAFANSDSQWLSFIDSDDWVHPQYLQRLLNAAVSNDADMAFCTLTAFTEDHNGYQEFEFWKKPVCSTREGSDILMESTRERNGLLSGHHVIAWNKIYKKHIFLHLRYPIGQVHEDEAIAHRVLSACRKVTGISDSLYYYRQNPKSIMNTQNGIFRAQCIALAYGDRIQCYYSQRIDVSDALYYRYWTELIRTFCLYSQNPKCTQLISRTKRQMRQLVRYYLKTNVSIFMKLGVTLFCCMPSLVSCLFTISVKIRGG